MKLRACRVVGEINIFGVRDYAHAPLARSRQDGRRSITAGDVVKAVREQTCRWPRALWRPAVAAGA